MVPVVLSILLVVLMSGAVLWVVADDHGKPRSEHGEDGASPVPAPPPPPPPAAPPHHPATSRRRPLPPPPAVPMATARPAMVTARMSGAPLPRHRLRSSALLVLLVLVLAVLVAAVIGLAVTALAIMLRGAVTS